MKKITEIAAWTIMTSALTITSLSAGSAFPGIGTETRLRPTEGVYVTSRNGHFYYEENRLRLWGVCRHDSVNLDTARRIREMGFNAIRLWGPVDGYDAESAKKGILANKAPNGSTAGLDRYDRFFAECKKQGLFIMLPSLMYYEGGIFQSGLDLDKGILADDSFVAGGADWNEWKAALKDKDVRKYFRFFKYFDERIRRIDFSHAESFLRHVNPYTGKSYAEDEAIAMYEIQNENGFLFWSPDQGVDKWPPYFRDKLLAQWNSWLREKYGTEKKIEEAWSSLDSGESLAENKILLRPLFSERNRYSEKRAEDLLRFLIGLVLKHNEDFRSHCRALAPVGKGVSVVPFTFDTQFRNSIPWLYANSRGDAVCFGTYQWALTSTLQAPPGFYVLDGNTVEGKPTVLYEVNTSRPNPYRSEFAFRLSAFASWQDWDAVFWHYWDEPAAIGDARFQKPRAIPGSKFLETAMPILTKSDAIGNAGFSHATDPVMCSSMALAGELFVGFHLKPAPAPAKFLVGPNQVFEYKNFTGIPQTRAAFSTGARVVFDEKPRAEVAYEGPAVGDQVSEALPMGDEILWDWPNGRLIIDSPRAKVLVGFTGDSIEGSSHRFKDGIVLGVGKVPFASAALISADGKPLASKDGSTKMWVNGLFDARNTDFDFDFGGVPANGGFIAPSVQGERNRATGKAPVIQDKVSLEWIFPNRLSYQWNGFDFALEKVDEESGKDAAKLPLKDKSVFLGLIEIQNRGAAIDTQRLGLVKSKKESITKTGSSSTYSQSGLWSPIPGVDWNMDYASAHQFLRDSSFLFSSISRFDSSDKADKTIVWVESQALFKSTANIELVFEKSKLVKIAATFTQPPSLASVIAVYEKELGTPLEKKIVTEAYNTSRVAWNIKGKKSGSVEVVVTETQGSMGIVCKRGE